MADFSEEKAPSGIRFWKLVALALASGLLLAATIPVKGIPWLMLLALVPLLAAEEIIHRNRKAYRTGAFFLLSVITFMVWGLFGSWWLKNAHWFGAFSAVLVNTLLMAVSFQLFHGGRKVFRKDAPAYSFLLAVWIAMEFFHHHWDLTYPWYSLGNVFSAHPAWIQWYEYTGVLGGSLWLLVANILVWHLLKCRFFPMGRRPLNPWFIALLLSWVLLPPAFSVVRYATYFRPAPKEAAQQQGFEVVLVQPNNDPYTEQYSIDPRTAVGNFLQLAGPLLSDETRFVVGPESMIQENIWEGHFDRSPSIDSLAQYVRQHPEITVITGASSFKMLRKGDPVTVSTRQLDPAFLYAFESNFGVPAAELSGYYDAYNLGFAIDRTGITGLTHKSKLVAGVERMPFKKYLSALVGDLALDMGGTIGTLATDDSRFVFRHNPSGIHYGVAICYESVFGEFFADFVRNGARMMFIITNDGWWGNTPGHRQHNAFASIRAIETRRDIARSANTGISCFINQRGDVLQPTPYWKSAAITGTIVPNSKITFYVRYGDYIGRIAAFVAFALWLVRIGYGLVPAGKRRSR
ncbi:MAG TPA: apolipoprotein N-acyltransferase [Bacteroidales bacterium]|nr:apolipoprotein N-acyltransferase [Bacteroidales bacterium]HRZ49527.1 apolipoprotein N-acyltransferase [Bacteroidales bacterium]